MPNLKELDIRKIENYQSLKVLSRSKSIYKLDRRSEEEGLLKETIKDAEKNRTVIYELYHKESNEVFGIIALSASRLASKPALLIDYFFICLKYRNKIIEENITYSSYLMAKAFEVGLFIQSDIGLSNLILYPTNSSQKLRKYYTDIHGFIVIKEKVLIQNKFKNETWLFLPLKTS